MVYYIWTKFTKPSINSTIFLTILQYKKNRKMKMLQEYLASTVIFIGISVYKEI